MKTKTNLMQVIISLLIIIILAYFVLIAFNKHTDGEIFNMELHQGVNTTGPIESGVTIEQTLIAQENYLCRLDILLSHYTEPDNSAATIELFDEKNNIIFSETVPVCKIKENSYRTLKFEPIINSKGKVFKLILKCDAVGWTHSMVAWCTNNEYTEGNLLINGEEVNYDIVFKTYSGTEVLSNKMLVKSLVCVLLCALIVLLYFFWLKKHEKNIVKLICWVLCSFLASITVLSIYLKITGKFINYNLFDSESILKAVLILPYIMLFFSLAFNDLSKVRSKHQIKDAFLQMWGAIYPVLLIDAVFSFMLLIYEPILVYSANKNDFKFDIGMMMPSLLLFFLIGFVQILPLFVVIYLINQIVSPDLNVFYCVTVGYFVIFLATYIQGNWLAGDLPVLSGDSIQWDHFLKNDVITLLIWLMLIIVAICVTVRIGSLKTAKIVSGVSVVVFIMLFVGMVSIIAQNNAFKGKGGVFIPTMENYNTVSSDKNFLVFVVDTVDSQTFKSVMDSNTEYMNLFEDFSYFKDTMSVYPFTVYSVPNFLTGTVIKSEKDFVEYCNEAYNNSPLLEELEKSNYDINIYSSAVLWGANKKFEIKNSASSYLKLDVKKLFEQEMKYVSFKYLPYAYKVYSQIETADFNIAFECDKELYHGGNLYNYLNLKSTSLDTQNKPVFQLIHIEGAHPEFNLDKDLDKIENGTYEQEIEACITILKTYIKRLKDAGAYDNSVIIIMSDHGFCSSMENPPADHWSFAVDGKETLGRFNPLFMVKGVNEKHDNYIESDIPLSYWTDLQDAYQELIVGEKSTELFSNIPLTRKRKILSYAQSSHHFVEFETDGKAWEWEKFKPTGNTYDIEK